MCVCLCVNVKSCNWVSVTTKIPSHQVAPNPAYEWNECRGDFFFSLSFCFVKVCFPEQSKLTCFLSVGQNHSTQSLWLLFYVVMPALCSLAQLRKAFPLWNFHVINVMSAVLTSCAAAAYSVHFYIYRTKHVSCSDGGALPKFTFQQSRPNARFLLSISAAQSITLWCAIKGWKWPLKEEHCSWNNRRCSSGRRYMAGECVDQHTAAWLYRRLQGLLPDSGFMVQPSALGPLCCARIHPSEQSRSGLVDGGGTTGRVWVTQFPRTCFMLRFTRK